jgi:hypothetical protein
MQPGTYAIELNFNAVIAVSILGVFLIVTVLILIRYGFKVSKVDGIIFGGNEKKRFNEMYDLLKKFEKELNGIKLDILRLNLISTENPIEERLDAGKRYIEAGGNGPASVLYEKLRQDYQDGLL